MYAKYGDGEADWFSYGYPHPEPIYNKLSAETKQLVDNIFTEKKEIFEEINREYKSKIKSAKTAKDKDMIKQQVTEVKKELTSLLYPLITTQKKGG